MDEGLTLKDGTPLRRDSGRRPAKAYTVDEQDEITRWRAERLRAAELVVTHPFWGERTRARAALKHHVLAAGHPADG